MPVIVFASSKGGAGKTTACTVLACELARQGRDKNIGVSIVDADPEKNLSAWAQMEGKPDNIKIFNDVSESNILDVIEDARKHAPFVLVDLEGVASNTVTFALSQADLVIIPCQASQMDANKAVKVIKMIKNNSRMIQRDIAFAVLFNRLSAAIVTKTGKHLAEEFSSGGIDVFRCSLIERECYKSIFSYGGAVNDLDAKNRREQDSIDKAAENANLFAEEVKIRLKHGLEASHKEREATHV